MCATIKGTSLLEDTQLQNYANLSPFNFVLSLTQKRFVGKKQSLSGFSVQRLRERFMHWNSIKQLTLNKMGKLLHKTILKYVFASRFSVEN